MDELYVFNAMTALGWLDAPLRFFAAHGLIHVEYVVYRPIANRVNSRGEARQAGPSKSWMPVSPAFQARVCVCSISEANSFTDGCGINLATRSMASSNRIPVAWPAASRWITPPAGFGVLSVIPAACSAALFT